jgi:hypothetical protein
METLTAQNRRIFKADMRNGRGVDPERINNTSLKQSRGHIHSGESASMSPDRPCRSQMLLRGAGFKEIATPGISDPEP